MHCELFYDLWATLTNSLWNIGSDLSSISDADLTNVLLQVIRNMMIKQIKSF